MKLKNCRNCGQKFKPYYKTTEMFCSLKCSYNYQNENRKHRVKTQINKVSDKMYKRLKEYTKLKKEFLKRPENKFCRITGEPATEIHHKYPGKDRQKYFLDVSTWVAVSRNGHIWIHNNTIEAEKLGLIKRDT